MFLLKILLLLIISFIIYKEVIRGRKTPSLNMNFMPILYIVGLAGVVWFIASFFFPGFWGRYYGSDLFWPSIIAIGICLYFWSQAYSMAMILFFIIIFLILYQFGDFESKEEKIKKYKATVVVWKINSSNDSTVVYNGPAGVRLDLPPATTIRVTPECGRTISVLSKGWDHSVILKGCNPGTVDLPQLKKWIQIESI